MFPRIVKIREIDFASLLESDADLALTGLANTDRFRIAVLSKVRGVAGRHIAVRQLLRRDTCCRAADSD